MYAVGGNSVAARLSVVAVTRIQITVFAVSGFLAGQAALLHAALILSILDNILGLRNIQSEYQAILKGIIIVLAVILQRKPTGGAQAIDYAVKILEQKQTPQKKRRTANGSGHERERRADAGKIRG